MTHHESPENPADAVPWKGPEGSPSTKATRSVPVRTLVSSLKISVGTILYRARLILGDTITEVGSLVTLGMIGSKILETGQLCSAVRCQMDNYPTGCQGGSDPLGIMQAWIRDDC